jgi:hypothetical protein
MFDFYAFMKIYVLMAESIFIPTTPDLTTVRSQPAATSRIPVLTDPLTVTTFPFV